MDIEEPEPTDPSKHAAALFILKTTEKHRLPLSAMEFLASDISSLVANAVHKVEERICAALSATGADALVREICSEDAINNPFMGLETTYQQTKYFRDHLGLLVSAIPTCMYMLVCDLLFLLCLGAS